MAVGSVLADGINRPVERGLRTGVGIEADVGWVALLRATMAVGSAKTKPMTDRVVSQPARRSRRAAIARERSTTMRHTSAADRDDSGDREV